MRLKEKGTREEAINNALQKLRLRKLYGGANPSEKA